MRYLRLVIVFISNSAQRGKWERPLAYVKGLRVIKNIKENIFEGILHKLE